MVNFVTLDTTIITNLNDEEREQSAAYLNENLVPAGASVIGGHRIEIDHPYVVAFIDRNPGANWMHPCRYLLLNPTGGQLISIESDRPPVFGVLPSTWRLVSRSPGLEDWRIIRIAPKSSPSDSGV
jgi:hypothetical protein